MTRPIFGVTLPAQIAALQTAGATWQRDPNGGFRLTNTDGTHAARQVDEGLMLVIRALLDEDMNLREILAPVTMVATASVGTVTIT